MKFILVVLTLVGGIGGTSEIPAGVGYFATKKACEDAATAIRAAAYERQRQWMKFLCLPTTD